MPDYSDWLTPARLAETEQEWAKMDRSELIEAIMEHKPERVIEFCCGTGWIPYDLPLNVEYLGIDANAGCIELAMKKNPTRLFTLSDVREFATTDVRDMALAFSCLKHFSLAEWDDIYGKVLRSGKRTFTSIFMGDYDNDDDSHGFPHTAVTQARVGRVVRENGHRIVKIFTLPPLNKEPEPLVLTEAVDGGTDLVSSEGLREDDDSGGGRAVPLRGGLLGGVQDEAGDPSGKDPDGDQEGPGEGPPRTTEWPL